MPCWLAYQAPAPATPARTSHLVACRSQPTHAQRALPARTRDWVANSGVAAGEGQRDGLAHPASPALLGSSGGEARARSLPCGGLATAASTAHGLLQPQTSDLAHAVPHFHCCGFASPRGNSGFTAPSQHSRHRQGGPGAAAAGNRRGGFLAAAAALPQRSRLPPQRPTHAFPEHLMGEPNWHCSSIQACCERNQRPVQQTCRGARGGGGGRGPKGVAAPRPKLTIRSP